MVNVKAKEFTTATDGNGKGTLQNLKLGSYYVLEEKAPAGYVLNIAKLPLN